MTDSPHRQGAGPGEQHPQQFPGTTDPAYAGTPYQQTYPAPPATTQKLPTWGPPEYTGFQPYATGGNGVPPGSPPQDPAPQSGPPSRKWLWVAAGLAVLTVIGLVIAVVLVNDSSQHTVVAPPDLEPEVGTPSPAPTTTRRTPPTQTPAAPPSFTLPPIPLPPQSPPGQPTGPTEPAVYDVAGTGRAISITYVDTGGVLQTEFNVMLPWTKQVELQQPASSSASVTVINFGYEVTCSIEVGGEEVDTLTGSGLTMCGALG